MWLLLFCLCHLAYAQDNTLQLEEDLYKITGLLQSAIVDNDVALNRLNGIFFAGQEYEQESVKVHYVVHIPTINGECSIDCNCWDWNYTANCNRTGNCPDGYCCIVKHFIWGRVPSIVYDSIYRAMTICPFIIGSSSEKSVTIELKNLNQSFPCTWCCMDTTNNDLGDDDSLSTIMQKVFSVPVSEQLSLLDHALVVITEKVNLSCYIIIIIILIL